MFDELAKAPVSPDIAVLTRQAELRLSTSAQLIRDGALNDLVLRRTITLPPHPPVELGDPVDWHMDPLGERNWCAQLHMFRWLRPLVDHLKSGKDPRISDVIKHYLESWVASAYPVECAPRYAWADMIDAVRALELVDAFVWLDADTQKLVTDILYSHGEWLSKEENLGHSNHAVWQHTALFVVGSVFERDDWIAIAKQRIEHAFDFEYDEEGINREAAPGYHLYNYVLWHDVDKRMQAEGHSLASLSGKLDLAKQALVHFTWPDGNLVEIGDTGPKTHLKKLKGDSEVDYVLTKGAEGTVPEEIFASFKAGYVFSRSGWGANARDYKDEFFWNLRFGEIGVHGHNDLGSLLLGAQGERLLIDAGKYAYLSNENKKYVISREAHNTLIVKNGEVLEDVSYALKSMHHSGSVDDVVIEGFPYRGIRHTRRVIYVRGADAAIVIDNVTSKKNHEYELLWHLDPKAKVITNRRVHKVSVGSASFVIKELGSSSRAEIVTGVSHPHLQGWHSPKWAVMEPTPTLCTTKEGSRLRFVTVIAADPKGKFSVETVKKAKDSFLITTDQGFFTTDITENPAKVSYSRELPPESSVLPQDLTALEDRIVRKIEGADEKLRTDLGQLLLNRLFLVSGEDGRSDYKVADVVSKAFLIGNEDNGLKTALLDLLSYTVGAGSRIVIEAKQVFSNQRSPYLFINYHASDDLRLAGSYETELFANGTKNGFRIIGEHVLPWSSRRGNDTLIIRFNGAIDRSRTDLPYFGGLSSLLSREESLIVFSDPSFDKNPDLTLGWYLGKTPDNTSLYDAINEVIDSFVDAWGIKKVLIFGTSGGGYASLQVGLRREDARILPINPQTVLSNYFQPFYKRGRNSAFADPQLAESLLPEAFDTRRLLKAASSSLIVHYVDNSAGDIHHHQNHFVPFSEAAERAQFKFKHIEVDLGKGHKAPSALQISSWINDLLAVDETD